MAEVNTVSGLPNQSIGRTWWVGIWPALIGIVALELFSRFSPRMTSPGPILMLAVVYSAFVGGLQSGLVAAGLLLIYHSYFFYYQTDGSTERIVRLATLSVVTPLMAILVGISKRRAESAASELSRRESEQRFRGEQDRTQSALVEAEERVRMAVQSANVGTWDWDLRADELVFSDRCKMIFGLPVDQPITYELFVKLLHPDDRARTIDVVENVLAPDSNGDYELEYRAIWPDGSIHWVSARGHAFFEGEGKARKPVRFTGTALDMTDRKEAELQVRRAKEEAESANQAKDQFLAALSHELRTPLTPVLLTATALENDPGIAPKLREDLGLIRRNVELEARLIDDLLDLTRIARGKLQLDRRALDPATCLTAALEVCHDDLVSKGLKLKLSDPQGTRFVQADPARLQQILWNLIKNAVKFTSTGGEVRITCEDVGDRYRVTVNDTGIGIDPEILPRIFDAFEQGQDLITRQFGGLGMGLAISKALVDLHDGTLTAHSDGKDQGATFVMELPTVPAPIAEQPTASPQPSAAVLRSLRILLVEDHDATNRVLSLLLRQLKHEVTSTTTVADALRHADRCRFDLLISDLGLPDGSGLDLMRELREKYHLTGICLSGYGMDHDIRRSKEAGFARHLTKPVDFRRLKATIESVVS